MPLNSGLHSPIVLCHPACSGGSLIYKMLVARFGLVGVYEVGFILAGRMERFQPLDPELQLYHQGILDNVDIAHIFKQRIIRCVEIAAANNQRLLIREHTQQFFFDDDTSQTPDVYSWIATQLSQSNESRIPTIITVRDPIDCWLGMRHSFPSLVSYDFDEYCRRFNQWLDRMDEARAAGLPVMITKYEAIVSNPNEMLSQIGEFVQATAATRPDDLASVVTSGNSGRQSNQLRLRERRPYTHRFAAAARLSTEYQRLAARLHYPMLEEPDISTKMLHALIGTLSRSARMLLRTARKCSRPIRDFGRKFILTD